MHRQTARRAPAGEPSAAPASPQDWYANLLWLDGRKCVLLVHADTLFPLGILDPDHVQVAKTASRQVLGVMNDLAFHVELAVADAGGLAGCDLERLNHDLRRTLNQRDRRYATALDRRAERLPGTQPDARHRHEQPEPAPARARTARVTKPSWVDERVAVLLAELRELGTSASQTAAADLIRERVQWVSTQMDRSPAPRGAT